MYPVGPCLEAEKTVLSRLVAVAFPREAKCKVVHEPELLCNAAHLQSQSRLGEPAQRI